MRATAQQSNKSTSSASRAARSSKHNVPSHYFRRFSYFLEKPPPPAWEPQHQSQREPRHTSCRRRWPPRRRKRNPTPQPARSGSARSKQEVMHPLKRPQLVVTRVLRRGARSRERKATPLLSTMPRVEVTPMLPPLPPQLLLLLQEEGLAVVKPPRAVRLRKRIGLGRPSTCTLTNTTCTVSGWTMVLRASRANRSRLETTAVWRG